VMRRLMAERNPVYANADITVESREVPHEVIVGNVIDALAAQLGCAAKAGGGAQAAASRKRRR